VKKKAIGWRKARVALREDEAALRLAPFYACCVDLCVGFISVCLDEYQRKRRRGGNGKPYYGLLLACPQICMCRTRFSI